MKGGDAAAADDDDDVAACGGGGGGDGCGGKACSGWISSSSLSSTLPNSSSRHGALQCLRIARKKKCVALIKNNIGAIISSNYYIVNYNNYSLSLKISTYIK